MKNRAAFEASVHHPWGWLRSKCWKMQLTHHFEGSLCNFNCSQAFLMILQLTWDALHFINSHVTKMCRDFGNWSALICKIVNDFCWKTNDHHGLPAKSNPFPTNSHNKMITIGFFHHWSSHHTMYIDSNHYLGKAILLSRICFAGALYFQINWYDTLNLCTLFFNKVLETCASSLMSDGLPKSH